jgi:hypothetical protein
MSFDPTKPVQTKSGKKARIICTDRNLKNYPIVALISEHNDTVESFAYYNAKGEHLLNSNEDLINIPKRHVHADLIIAWANGAKIQYGAYLNGTHELAWEDSDSPCWYHAHIYRIKPTE